MYTCVYTSWGCDYRMLDYTRSVGYFIQYLYLKPLLSYIRYTQNTEVFRHKSLPIYHTVVCQFY